MPWTWDGRVELTTYPRTRSNLSDCGEVAEEYRQYMRKVGFQRSKASHASRSTFDIPNLVIVILFLHRGHSSLTQCLHIRQSYPRSSSSSLRHYVHSSLSVYRSYPRSSSSSLSWMMFLAFIHTAWTSQVSASVLPLYTVTQVVRGLVVKLSNSRLYRVHGCSWLPENMGKRRWFRTVSLLVYCSLLRI